jgi:hypothetical protein
MFEVSFVVPVIVVLLTAFAVGFTVEPTARIEIAILLHFALSVDEGLLDFTFVVGAVGQYEEAIFVLYVSVFELAFEV